MKETIGLQITHQALAPVRDYLKTHSDTASISELAQYLSKRFGRKIYAQSIYRWVTNEKVEERQDPRFSIGVAMLDWVRYKQGNAA